MGEVIEFCLYRRNVSCQLSEKTDTEFRDCEIIIFPGIRVERHVEPDDEMIFQDSFEFMDEDHSILFDR